MDIDTTEFENALYRECADSFAAIIREQAQSGIYLIGLYHSGGGSWSPIVHTYLGLDQVVGEYLSSSYAQGRCEASLRRDLRWSSCDMPIHGDYESHLAVSEQLLQQMSERVDEAFELVEDPEDVSILDEFDTAIRSAITRVLMKLEQEQLFAPLGNRDGFVVGIVCGDESIKDKHRATIPLNPESSLRELAEDAAYFEEESRRLFDQTIMMQQTRKCWSN
ncbi:DUF4303 domain-containing protein [Hahella ganghwensis]|uniref:DUF4303 domain-containing protein n=1 Tax=Hahella ganghwensis TaxID=286420 RepID=UPI000364556A|nr:DUF4303 domain-containing protein [Hahella ganghwensis]